MRPAFLHGTHTLGRTTPCTVRTHMPRAYIHTSRLVPSSTAVPSTTPPCLWRLALAAEAWRACPTSCCCSLTSMSATSRASTRCVAAAAAWLHMQPALEARADVLQRKDELQYWLTEHLRLNGLYWGLTALHLLGHPDALPRNDVLDFVLSCLHDNGGFGAAPGHDAHMLYTVSAVQLLATLDAFADLDERVKGGRLKIGQCALDCRLCFARVMLTVCSHRRPTASRDRHFCRGRVG